MVLALLSWFTGPRETIELFSATKVQYNSQLDTRFQPEIYRQLQYYENSLSSLNRLHHHYRDIDTPVFYQFSIGLTILGFSVIPLLPRF